MQDLAKLVRVRIDNEDSAELPHSFFADKVHLDAGVDHGSLVGDNLVLDQAPGYLLILADEVLICLPLVLAHLHKLQVGELVLVDVEVLGSSLHLDVGVLQQCILSDCVPIVIHPEFLLAHTNQNQCYQSGHYCPSAAFHLFLIAYSLTIN